jgi:hypothetical protein
MGLCFNAMIGPDEANIALGQEVLSRPVFCG